MKKVRDIISVIFCSELSFNNWESIGSTFLQNATFVTDIISLLFMNPDESKRGDSLEAF
jgi:hypothetical protein